MEPETLDRTSELAKEKLVELNKDEEASKAKADKKAEEESKGASSGDSSPEKKETKGGKEDKAEDSDGTTKNDVQILESKDEDLTDDEKNRKQELIKAKEEARSPEDKLKEWQDNTQKRIDELNGDLKAEKEGRRKDAEVIEKLEQMIVVLKGDLEASGSIESEDDKITKSEEEVYAKMMEEDKKKPFEQRREMSKEDLEEFMLEDYVGAHEWMLKRDKRRESEREAKVKGKEAAKAINAEVQRFFTEFPGCNQENRWNELKASGMKDDAIDAKLREESEDYKLMMEIMQDDPKYRDPVKGPQLMADEIRKRKSESGKEKSKLFTEEEVKQREADAVKREQDRQKSIDLGLGSGGGGTGGGFSSDDPLYRQKLELFIKAGKRKGQTWTEKDFKETLEYGKKQRAAHPLSRDKQGKVLV